MRQKLHKNWSSPAAPTPHLSPGALYVARANPFTLEEKIGEGAIDNAAKEMLKLGLEVEVMEPEALRQRMKDVTRRLAALYSAAKITKEVARGRVCSP